MQIYYMNDESQNITVRVLHGLSKLGDGSLDEEFFTLEPQCAKLFTVRAPEGFIPYLKRWNSRLVLLTHVDPSLLLP